MARRVLIIEDSNEDFKAILRSLGQACADLAITRSLDGDDALEMLRDTRLNGKIEHLPQIILLDLNLPGTDGREILADIKSDELFKLIPVVILSTSTNPNDIADCYLKGANGYCLKPVNRVRFDETIQAINSFWFRAVKVPERLHLQ